MTKYLISGYIGFDNFGDEAILKVLTSNLKNIGAEKITVLSSNPKKTSEIHNVFSVHYLKFLKPILDTDVLISGGGSLLQDITSLKSLIYYLTIIVTALVFNKKVIIFAQGFTPFRTKIGKILTSFILKFCNKIYVRDIKSLELLKSMKIDSELVSDPVFGLDVLPKEHKGIGIQLRNFPTITEVFLNSLAENISENFKKEEIKLLSLQDNLDLEILEKFSKILKQKGIESKIYKNNSIIETIKNISNLEYLIGMRFHANLIAVKSRVKVLGINYDIKVENLAKTINFPLIEINNIKNDQFKNLINLDTTNYQIPEFNFPKI